MKAKFQQSAGNSNTHEMDNLKCKVAPFHEDEDGNTSNADNKSCTDVFKI